MGLKSPGSWSDAARASSTGLAYKATPPGTTKHQANPLWGSGGMASGDMACGSIPHALRITKQSTPGLSRMIGNIKRFGIGCSMASTTSMTTVGTAGYISGPRWSRTPCHMVVVTELASKFSNLAMVVVTELASNFNNLAIVGRERETETGTGTGTRTLGGLSMFGRGLTAMPLSWNRPCRPIHDGPGPRYKHIYILSRRYMCYSEDTLAYFLGALGGVYEYLVSI